jgi:hypothetical protein
MRGIRRSVRVRTYRAAAHIAPRRNGQLEYRTSDRLSPNLSRKRFGQDRARALQVPYEDSHDVRITTSEFRVLKSPRQDFQSASEASMEDGRTRRRVTDRSLD